jgi:hypothetical protein
MTNYECNSILYFYWFKIDIVCNDGVQTLKKLSKLRPLNILYIDIFNKTIHIYIGDTYI